MTLIHGGWNLQLLAVAVWARADKTPAVEDYLLRFAYLDRPVHIRVVCTRIAADRDASIALLLLERTVFDYNGKDFDLVEELLHYILDRLGCRLLYDWFVKKYLPGQNIPQYIEALDAAIRRLDESEPYARILRGELEVRVTGLLPPHALLAIAQLPDAVSRTRVLSALRRFWTWGECFGYKRPWCLEDFSLLERGGETTSVIARIFQFEPASVLYNDLGDCSVSRFSPEAALLTAATSPDEEFSVYGSNA
jgi:hypothetical protein